MIRLYANRDYARNAITIAVVRGDCSLSSAGVWEPLVPGETLVPAFSLEEFAAQGLVDDLQRSGISSTASQNTGFHEMNRIEALQDMISMLKADVKWLRRQCQNRNQTITVQDLTHRQREAAAHVREIRVPESPARSGDSGEDRGGGRTGRAIETAHASLEPSASVRGAVSTARDYMDAVDASLVRRPGAIYPSTPGRPTFVRDNDPR